MNQSDDNAFIPMTSVSDGKRRDVKPGVFYYTNQVVNVVFIGEAENWVLMDTGMPGSATQIKAAAAEHFGKDSRPKAIILTHGHFDHTGNIVALVDEWKVPVYAHPLEFPFLTGEQDYPEPDSSVEGGLLAKLSVVFPHKAINIEEALQPLPADHTMPFLKEWTWIHTPGHSPGHVSFFRKSDKVLIAGDAFVTVRQDSLYKVLVQKEEVNGPPRYLTTDWDAAKRSVIRLAALDPEIAVTGHGTTMQGEALRQGLQKLVDEFDTMALPEHGKFVNENKQKQQ